MNFANLVKSLSAFPGIIQASVSDLSDEQFRWKPSSGNWSILEIICHLADEEVADFRMRVTITLNDPSKPWPSIDPENWAIERVYNDSDPALALQRFITERQSSVRTLEQLADPNWDHVYTHPKFGPFRAGDIFAAWCAHDWLHLRQIAKRRFEMVQQDAGTYVTKYAGLWGA